MTLRAIGGAAAETPRDLVVAVEAYADYLRVERGLAAATIRAYDTDLRMFGRDAPGIEGWATSPEPAPIRSRPGPAAHPAPPPKSDDLSVALLFTGVRRPLTTPICPAWIPTPRP